MTDTVLLDREGSVATVTLNRPDKLNAMSLESWRRILALVRDDLDPDDTLRCVVFRGAGEKAFAAGADISEFPAIRRNVDESRIYGTVISDAMRAVAGCRHPTVAAIEGVCVGAGLALASCCDMRICGRSSRFGAPIKRLGLTMGFNEMEGLVRLVGQTIAMEILLEGRLLDAERAVAIGLVNRVVEDGEAIAQGHRAAASIAEGAPLSARFHKRFVRRLADGSPLTTDEQASEFDAMSSADYQEGVSAFLEKRPPRFQGR